MPETYTSGIWIVKEGAEDAFVAAWKEFAQWATTMPGAGTLRLVRDHDDHSRYMSFAPWSSHEVQARWKETTEFREGMARVREHVSDFKPSVFELVAEVG